MSRASRAWLAGALTGSVEASEREIMNAIYFELVGPLQDADCFCTGPWASFHHMFNFTLAHAPLTAGTLAERSAPSVALCERATPLVRKTLRQIMEEDGRLKKEALRTLSSENWVSFDGHWCPTGLVAALSLCAAVHVQLARPEEEEEEDPVETIDWAQALVTWPDMLPDDCERHYWCLAYMEGDETQSSPQANHGFGLLALATVRHCGPCIAQAHWFITAQEVNDNVVRWLPWLRQRPGVPPPRWRSGIAAEASRPGKHRATTLLNNMITAWSEPSSKLSWRQTLFEKIFGQLADLPGMQARGIQEVHVEGHPEDFTGRRSGLRFYIYNLPGALFEVLRQLHGRVREAESQPAACNLGLAPCTETHNPRGTFNSLRPFMAESTFLAKLLSGPDHVIVEELGSAKAQLCCIPVVMLFPGGSWYRSHGPPIASSFPFPSRIDWRGLSLELPFDPSNSTAFQWAKEMMVMLLQMDPRDVYRKQQLLVAAAPLLRFDFRGRAPDAFTALLDELAARPLRPPEHLERGARPGVGMAQSCNVGRTADGSCVSFDEAEHGDPERQRNLKSHLEAILLRQSKFEEVLEEDQDCIF
eukprot:g12150.t1